MAKKEIAAEWVDISTIQPDPNNPRFNANTIPMVVDSIKKFGFSSPIIVRKADNIIIAGHTRYQAAKDLNLDKVPVRYMDLDPVDAKRLALADNKIQESSAWDYNKLTNVLQDIQNVDVDFILGLGFNDNELDNILDRRAPGDTIHGEGPSIWKDEWQDMPEFDQQDETSHRSIIVHFENNDDVIKFQELIEQQFGPKQKSIWYPAAEVKKTTDIAYDDS